MKSNAFQLSHGIESIRRSKSYQLHTLRKRVFTAATFKCLWVVSFHTELKNVLYFGLFESSSHF